MKLIFDRTAHLNETSVLTNFEKRHEVPADITVRELMRRFMSQHLKFKAPPGSAPVWRIIAVSDMAMREVALVENDEAAWINSPEESLTDFLGPNEPVTILAIYQRPEEAALLKNPVREDQPWQKLQLPVRVDTRGREILAYMLGLLAIASLILVIVQYNYNKVILTEGIVGVILCTLGFYFLLLYSRNIVFSSRSVMYRNRYSKYEKFNVSQFEYLDWSGHGRTLKFVFKFEEKGRNFISAETESFLELVVWSVSHRIPIYSSDSLN